MADDKDKSELIKDFVEFWQKQFPYQLLNHSFSQEIFKDFGYNIKHEQNLSESANSNIDINSDIHEFKQRIAKFEKRIIELEERLK